MSREALARIRSRLAERLGPRDRRALRWGGLALLPALVWAAAVSPWLDAAADRRERLASLRTLVRAEEELLATGDRYPRAVEAAARRVARLSSRLLDGRSEGVAVAEVHQMIEDLARAARVRLTSVRPRGVHAAAPGLAAAVVEIQGESDLRGIVDLLRSLETGGKLLRAWGLRVRSAPDRAGHQVLAFRAAVAGYLVDPDADEAAGGGSRTAAGSMAAGREAVAGGSDTDTGGSDAVERPAGAPALPLAGEGDGGRP